MSHQINQIHTADATSTATRAIVHRTRGTSHGFIRRLMSPSDLGHVVKPFVFLDLFDADATVVKAMQAGQGMSIHPHSGIATVTVLTRGSLHFADPQAGTGEITYGGVEWMRAGQGVWHGQEMTPNDPAGFQGFQLWLALPESLELQAPESCYLEAKQMPQIGAAHLIIGQYEQIESPVPAPEGINYLLVTLKAGEQWTYVPPAGHSVAWLAVASGAIHVSGESVQHGEMVVFATGEQPLSISATGATSTTFVLGSAVPHAHPLHLGNYSVHTSATALRAGETQIANLKQQMQRAGNRRTTAGTVPVFR